MPCASLKASERRRLRSHEMIHTRLLKRNEEKKRSLDQVVSLSLMHCCAYLLTVCLCLFLSFPLAAEQKSFFFIVHCVYGNDDDDDYMHTRLASCCKCSLAPERCLLSDFMWERERLILGIHSAARSSQCIYGFYTWFNAFTDRMMSAHFITFSLFLDLNAIFDRKNIGKNA